MTRKASSVLARFIDELQAEADKFDPANPRPEALYHRYLDEHYEITVYRMAFAYRVNYGETGVFGCVLDGYCYASAETALAAAAAWDGEAPILDGWHRHPLSGTRREGGDPSKQRGRGE